MIGGSTGGPKILREFFKELPVLNAAVLIVQHMPKYINESFVKALDKTTDMTVKIAENNEFLKHGTIYIAPSEMHTRLIRNKQIELYDADKVNFCKPSIDVTMQSLKEDNYSKITGVLLSGMGDDGLDGMQHIKSQKGETFAINDLRKALNNTIQNAKNRNIIDQVLSIEKTKSMFINNYSDGKTEKTTCSDNNSQFDNKERITKPQKISVLKEKLVIIGSSTGGPRILKRVFNGLPRLNVPIILVQHMPKFINKSIQSSLDNITDMTVKIASDGEIIQKGHVYIAPSEIHLSLENNNKKIKFVQGEKVNFVKPAIDVAMRSVKKINNETVIGVILTGMGRDGADGLSYIKKNLNGITISEDEESCVVYGMPKAAFETGDVDYVLNPEKVQEKIISLAS